MACNGDWVISFAHFTQLSLSVAVYYRVDFTAFALLVVLPSTECARPADPKIIECMKPLGAMAPVTQMFFEECSKVAVAEF